MLGGWNSCARLRGTYNSVWVAARSGTRRYNFTKAARACGTLGNAREGATLSSETGNGEENYYFFLVVKSVSTWDNILSADLRSGVLY